MPEGGFIPLRTSDEDRLRAVYKLQSLGRFLIRDASTRTVARAIKNWFGHADTRGSDSEVIHQFLASSEVAAQKTVRPYVVGTAMREAIQKCADYRAIPSLYVNQGDSNENVR